MSAAGSPTDGRSGFALVDVLVALTVAGLAGSALVGLVSFVGRQGQEAARREHMQDGTMAARRILQTLLSEAPALPQTGQRETGIRGTEAELIVASLGPQVLGLNHPATFTLRAEDAGIRTNLTLSWTAQAGGPEHRESVAEGYREAQFSYLGRAGRADQPTWRAQWTGGESRLEAVRLRVRFDNTAAATEIIVPIAADYPAACLRNPRLAGCPLADAR